MTSDRSKRIENRLQLILVTVLMLLLITAGAYSFFTLRKIRIEIEEITELYIPIAGIVTQIAPGLPPLLIDSKQISRVVLNLVTNAYQAMPDGGELTIKAQANKDTIHLSIADTGCGISRENMRKLFEPLFTNKTRGIGLSLAVSKNLVEINGGIIEAESEQGKGSTFTIILPVKER